MNTRRVIGAVAVIAVAAGAALVAGSLSSSTPPAAAGSGGGSTGGQIATATGTVPRCRTSNLEVWLGVGAGGAAAGSSYMPIEFTNTGSSPCMLDGYPGVSARSSSQLGAAAGRDTRVAGRAVQLGPGATAHSLLQLVDVGNYPPAA